MLCELEPVEPYEPLPSDEWHERDMKLGSLSLLRAIERARGNYALPAKPCGSPPAPKPFPSLCANFFIPHELMGARIIRLTAEAFGYSVAEMKGPGRQRRLICARMVAARLLRDHEDGSHRFSLTNMGRMLCRDHSTVSYWLDVFGSYRRTYPEMKAIYNLLRRRLA